MSVEYKCVNGHDLCHGGASAGPDCPYCEKRTSFPSKLVLHNCRDSVAASLAVAAVLGYLAHPEYPQHDKLGKRNGGGTRQDGAYFWVWKTAEDSWCVELMEEFRDWPK